MERRSVAPPRPKSIFTTAPSAQDPSRMTFLMIMSFASEWFFKPEGVVLVKKRFETELAKFEQKQPWDHQIGVQWIPQHPMWRIRCAKVDYGRVNKAFMNALTGVIRLATFTTYQSKPGNEDATMDDHEDEDADEDDAFAHDVPIESNLLQRLAVWEMQNAIGGPIAEVDSTDHEAQQDTQLTPVVAEDEAFPEEIRFYKFRQAWSCSDKTIMLEDLLPEADMKELVRLTSCQFSKNINEGVVFVGTHDEENLLLALHKLNNIEKNWQYRLSWVNHMFYDEETSNAKYVLKYFVDVKMFYFETTLLDNLQVTFSNGSCDYETLINAVTVRCAPHVPVKSEYVPIKKLNISPIKIEDIPGGVRVFSIAHTYCGKGDPSDNPMQYRPVQIPEHRPALAQQSDTQHIQNALVPPHLRNGSGVSFKDESVQRWATSVIGSGIAPTPGGLPNTLRNMPNGTLSNTGFQGASSQKADWDRYEEYKPEETDTIVEKQLYWKNRNHGPVGLINRNAISIVQPVSGVRVHVPANNVASHQQDSGMPRSASMPQVTTNHGLMEPLKPIILHPQVPPPVVRAQSWVQPQPPGFQRASQGRSQSQQHPPSGLQQATKARSQSQQRQPPGLQQAPQGQSRSQQRPPPGLQEAPQAQFRSVPQTTNVPHTGRSGPPVPWQESIDRSGRVQKSLLDDDDPILENLQGGVLQPVPRSMSLLPQVEQEQPVREPNSRIFHQTMNQRAPKPNISPFAGRIDLPFSPPKPYVSSSVPTSGLTEPLPDFVGELNHSFKELMTGLRGYRGKVAVQAEFGRIILGRFHPKQLSVKDKDNFIDSTYLRKIILEHTEYGPTVDFTSVLTAIPAEIQYMINMKGKGGQNIWEMNKISAWNTTYEFVFLDPRDPLYPVMIEIDAETFVAQIKARCRLGNLFMHGTKRHWDVKFAAIGYGNARALEDKYGDLATEIQSSLYIPPGSHRPYLSWKLDASLHRVFIIQEVTVRCVYEYKSTDHNSVLKVSEVQALDIDGGAIPEKPFLIFEAKPGNPDRAPIDKLTTWYEACTTSAKLDTALKQNESLDLGDETAWTLDDVANMEASKALYSPAFEMLQQMDGVGQHSHNGSDYRSRVPIEHAMQAKAEPEVVWW